MTKQEFDEMAALVVRLRKDLELHTDALRQSNAQCAEYLRHNEMLRMELDRISAERDTMQTTLHSELVEVRAALASATTQRDSYKQTLDEWEREDTKPHACVTADDVADHVAPPVLPMCTTCHECGGVLRPSRAAGSHSVLCCRTERCSRINTAWQDDVSPYSGACNSSTPVRHA